MFNLSEEKNILSLILVSIICLVLIVKCQFHDSLKPVGHSGDWMNSEEFRTSNDLVTSSFVSLSSEPLRTFWSTNEQRSLQSELLKLIRHWTIGGNRKVIGNWGMNHC